MQEIDILRIRSRYPRHPRHDGERLASIRGRRELRADTRARRVRDEVVIGYEEDRAVEERLEDLGVIRQNGVN